VGRVYDATWGRAFTALYDGMIKATEEAGLREIRREALSAASGRTLDVGAGTGANLELYPDAVSELVLAEPNPHMLRKLRSRATAAARPTEVLAAPAERLPLAEASVDTVVFTLVLCTVPDPEAALAEAARVLRAGGRLIFVEHVRSADSGVARWQDRLE
jgi:ubiquinone/menaquinone biosynthesis C-methylase UbiE